MDSRSEYQADGWQDRQMDGVRLRPLVFSDWRAVHGWAKLPESSKYQSWGPNTEAETESYVREASARWHSLPQTSFPHAIVVGDHEVVGIADQHLRGPDQAEIGYGVHPDRWGHGVATAAARELLRLAFEEHGIHRVYATCDPRNLASARVLAKIG